MTQKISKKNLKEIYSNVCEGWQKKLTEILLWSEGKEVELENSMIEQGYKEANPEQKKLIEKYFTINTPKKMIDKVKTFQDILDLAGVEESDILPWKGSKLTKNQKSQNALAKIQLICDVYNEGMEFDFKNSRQYKYYPYFEKNTQGCVIYSFSFWHTDANVPSGCYFKSSELAMDAGRKFIDIYKDYLPN